jgi:hypothetical protein
METWGRPGRLRDNDCHIIVVNIHAVTAFWSLPSAPLSGPTYNFWNSPFGGLGSNKGPICTLRTTSDASLQREVA